MCRWTAWIGSPIFVEDLVSVPSHSLVHQSQSANECKSPINGDGFGLAWYDQRPEPGIYRDFLPAWSDANLKSLASQVRSGLFMAHVRASTGSAISRNNCHPFAAGRWSFMHNGQIGGFEGFRRSADMLLSDDMYRHRKGATDSELLFLLALSEGLDSDPIGAFSRALATLYSLSVKQGRAPHLRIAAAFSNGAELWALRMASDALAPTVYYRHDPQVDGWCVASEPLDSLQSGWTVLPAGSIARFTKADIQVHPFLLADQIDTAVA
jgi:glutamine amidotransferase